MVGSSASATVSASCSRASPAGLRIAPWPLERHSGRPSGRRLARPSQSSFGPDATSADQSSRSPARRCEGGDTSTSAQVMMYDQVCAYQFEDSVSRSSVAAPGTAMRLTRPSFLCWRRISLPVQRPAAHFPSRKRADHRPASGEFSSAASDRRRPGSSRPAHLSCRWFQTAPPPEIPTRDHGRRHRVSRASRAPDRRSRSAASSHAVARSGRRRPQPVGAGLAGMNDLSRVRPARGIETGIVGVHCYWVAHPAYEHYAESPRRGSGQSAAGFLSAAHQPGAGLLGAMVTALFNASSASGRADSRARGSG